MSQYDPNDSSGIFVGVNSFTLETPSSIQGLSQSADDAVDLAEYFALKTEILLAKNVILCLSGDLRKHKSKAALQLLQEQGATVVPATYTRVLLHLDRATDGARADGLLIAAFSSHGFVEEGDELLVCEDSYAGLLSQTSLSLRRAFARLAGARAKRRLVLIDACRACMYKGTKSVTDAVVESSDPFSEAISSIRGTAVLAATRYGEFAFEDLQMGNSVFTASVLKGLHGDAGVNSRGFITAGTLAEYVDREVRDYVKGRHPAVELRHGISANFDDLGSQELPLTRHPEIHGQLAELKRFIDGGLTTEQYEQAKKLLISHEPERVQRFLKQLDRLNTEGESYLEEFTEWVSVQAQKCSSPDPSASAASRDLAGDLFSDPSDSGWLVDASVDQLSESGKMRLKIRRSELDSSVMITVSDESHGHYEDVEFEVWQEAEEPKLLHVGRISRGRFSFGWPILPIPPIRIQQKE